MEKLIYFWRVIGYMLGIEDQYNLCSADYHTVHRACRLLFERKFRPNLLRMNPESLKMSQEIVLTSSQIVTSLRFPVMFRFLFEMLDIPFHFEQTTMDRFLFQVMKLSLNKLIHFRLFSTIFNNLLKLALYKLTFKWMLRWIIRVLDRQATINA